MKQFFLILYLIVISLMVKGQEKIDVNGRLIDCSDKKPLILGTIVLLKDGKPVRSSSTKIDGSFSFKQLSKGNYQLQTDYFYYPSRIVDIKLEAGDEIEICIAAENPFWLIQNFYPKPIYTLYYFGMPAYSDKFLNEIGEKYGVRMQNLGCMGDDSFDKYNDMIRRILNYRNGNDWEKKYREEVKLKDRKRR